MSVMLTFQNRQRDHKKLDMIAKYGFDCDTCAVITSIDEQSPDIALGVNQALEAKGEMKIQNWQ